MQKATFNDLKIPLLIALIYWIPSSIALVDMIKGYGMLFPSWINSILFPGYFLGFALGYAGGNFWALVGQLITLLLFFIISRGVFQLFR
jgi:hypothetical protein